MGLHTHLTVTHSNGSAHAPRCNTQQWVCTHTSLQHTAMGLHTHLTATHSDGSTHGQSSITQVTTLHLPNAARASTYSSSLKQAWPRSYHICTCKHHNIIRPMANTPHSPQQDHTQQISQRRGKHKTKLCHKGAVPAQYHTPHTGPGYLLAVVQTAGRALDANLCYSGQCLQAFCIQRQMREGHVGPGGSLPSETHVPQVTLGNRHLLTHLVQGCSKVYQLCKW